MKLRLKQADKPKVMAWLSSAIDSLKPEKEYEITLSEERKKRSLTANAYAWVLIDKLAEYNNLPPEYIYIKAVQSIGGNGIIISVDTEAVKRTIDVWESRGLGWIAEPVGEYENFTELRMIYGSSVYDTHQMAQLIDGIVQDCQAAGIETMPPNELKSLVEAWEGVRKK